MDEFHEKWEEAIPKVENSSKEFLALVDDVFYLSVVQQGKTTMQNQEITKLMGCIAKGLGTIGSACEP